MLYVSQKREDIARFFPQAGVGAEIGVLTGRFAKCLGKRTRPNIFYLIDPWWTKYGEVFTYRPSLRTRDAYDLTVRRMQWWIDRKIAQVIVQRSQDALAAMPDEYLDWVYLDSSHEFAETVDELELCRKKVKATGVISGHDFNTRKHRGVFLALAGFLEAHSEYELFFQDNYDQWAIRRRTNRELSERCCGPATGQQQQTQ